MKSYALALIATSAMGVSLGPNNFNNSGSTPGPNDNTIGQTQMKGLESANEHDFNEDGRLSRNELQSYADSLDKGDKVDAIFDGEATIPISRAEELLKDDPDPVDPYTKEKAYERIRELVPDITFQFADMYVMADYWGNRDYTCTFKEFFEYLNADPTLKAKFDLSKLYQAKGEGHWEIVDILEDMDFIKSAFMGNFIDGYNPDDPKTWNAKEQDVDKFEGVSWVGEDSLSALEDQYEKQLPYEKFTAWLNGIFRRTNYLHEPDMCPRARKWLEVVDYYMSRNGYIQVGDLVGFVQSQFGPEFIEQLRSQISNGETTYGWGDDGLDYGHTFADIMMRAYIGPERDTTDAFADRATRLLKTIYVEGDEVQQIITSADDLEEYLVTDYLWAV